ncbi:MAG: hypothetical protein JOY65_05575, partial [Acetobacteraceae bacterium]|nr:hypothetical protein [Acetobacteraceae bacterium]
GGHPQSRRENNLAQKGDTEGAERSYAASLDWARHQQAKSFELRTATSYARLLREQGRVGEAHDLLAPVYGWFTEGFATKDLREAKALLDALEATRGRGPCHLAAGNNASPRLRRAAPRDKGRNK